MTDDAVVALRPTSETADTVALIAAARSNLAEARTLTDIRRVIEAAGVAVDAARRAAKLAQAQRMAADVVEAANEAANDAAAVRIEAQAKAGELLREMGEHGERASRGHPRQMSQPATFAELGITRSEASRWQQVAAVAAERRAEYVQQARAVRDEVSTAGMLRHAAEADQPSARRSIDHAAIAAKARKQALRVYRDLLALPGFRPESLVSALDRAQKRNLLRVLDQLSSWIDDIGRELAVHGVTREGS